MSYSAWFRISRVVVLSGALCGLNFLPALSPVAVAQVAGNASITGSVMDGKGGLLAKATVMVRNEAIGKTINVATDPTGHFSLTGLSAGTYTVQATAPGFGTTIKGVRVAENGTQDVLLTLSISDLTQQVTVEANAQGSIAAALAPMDALLEARSARTEITSQFIQNFTAPTADYGETVQMAPGTFTTNGNGVGLGQSKTYFRGFSDGSYDIDFDGVPFYDTNSPTHHSWAFFPSQWLGGVDFDRSPGTASTIGPTPFGGSIHLLSKEISPVQNLRGGFSYGSFNTVLFDGQYSSGNLLPNKKLSLEMDVHHMSSDGYQTFNYQRRSAGSIKVQYKFSDKTVLTGFSGVVFLDANTPNFNATRCQIYGVGAGYSCNISGTTTLLPYTGAGLNFLLADTSDPVNYLSYQYNRYHVPTDFEYVGLKRELGLGFNLDVKGYTYDYDNAELYSNATPITEATTINGSKTYNGLAIQPCNVAVVKKGVTALPCGVDKYNSYRKYGETATVSEVSKFGVARFGLWYEWARTNRHQFPSDPLNNWSDQTLPNFAENFWTNSFQPFGEYEFHVTPKLNVTAGTKFAYYTIDLKQYADNGKTIGNLCNLATPAVCAPYIRNHGTYSAWLPSLDANYRLRSNWSAYGQLATGSVVPPSSVYDYNQTATKAIPNPASLAVAPKQQRSTTYQFGSVLKLKRVTFDADFYHIRFQNSYSSTLDSLGEPVFFLQPSSITKGFEAESNVYITHGLSAYVNASVGRAYYTGNVYQSCVSGAAGCTATTPVLTESAPSGLWVAQTPTDVETIGGTYQRKAWDLGLFDKRVGTQRIDNGSYHNQAQIDPFSLVNVFANYTIRSGSRFDQTKIRLSFNNILNSHNLTGNSLAGTVASAPAIASNGTTYADAFNSVGATPVNGGDNVSLLSGRSVMLSVTFGLSPKR